MTQKQNQTIPPASWRDSNNVCVYADERLLGHIVRAGEGWVAFDAMHAASHGNAFRPLGFFPSITAAKKAVESATVPLPQADADSPRWNVV